LYSVTSCYFVNLLLRINKIAYVRNLSHTLQHVSKLNTASSIIYTEPVYMAPKTNPQQSHIRMQHKKFELLFQTTCILIFNHFTIFLVKWSNGQNVCNIIKTQTHKSIKQDKLNCMYIRKLNIDLSAIFKWKEHQRAFNDVCSNIHHHSTPIVLLPHSYPPQAVL